MDTLPDELQSKYREADEPNWWICERCSEKVYCSENKKSDLYGHEQRHGE